MDISIIIPVFNSEDTIKECIDSIMKAEIPAESEIEIIAVNDGSTDNTKSILESYSQIQIIHLSENSGRIIARKTGAENAKYENLLFIDSRVKIDKYLLEKIIEIDYQPVIAGGIKHDKYRSEYDTFFYLVRKKIYSPYFPQTSYSEKLFIDENNFFKAPKGTTCFFVNRNLFLSSLPGTDSKDTSDDTKIMKSIVFDKKIKILRHTALIIDYNQRTGKNVDSWILHRGRIWADYYLRYLNRYSILYYSFLTALVILFVVRPLSIIFLLAFTVGLSALYLCENKRDVLPVIKQVPYLGGLFFLGTLEKLFKMIFK